MAHQRCFEKYAGVVEEEARRGPRRARGGAARSARARRGEPAREVVAARAELVQLALWAFSPPPANDADRQRRLRYQLAFAHFGLRESWVFWRTCLPALAGLVGWGARPARRKRSAPRRRRVFTQLPMRLWDATTVTGLLYGEPIGPKPLRRPVSILGKKLLTRAEMAFGKSLVDDPVLDIKRPKTLAECLGDDAGALGAENACPWVGCSYHLALTVNDIGSIKVNFPGWDVDDIQLYAGATCAYKVGLQGAQTIETVARLNNISEERVRQVEGEVKRKLRRRAGEGPFKPRKLRVLR
jgi:hypothetical protein